MRPVAATLLAFLTTLVTMAQQYTLDQIVPGGKEYAQYAPIPFSRLQWWGEKLVALRGNSFYHLTPKSKGIDSIRLISIADLRRSLAPDTTSIPSKITDLRFSESGKPLIYYYRPTELIAYDLDRKAVAYRLPYPKGASNFDFDEERKQVVYTLANNLALTLSDGEQINLSTDSDPNHIYGQSVHRNEFGIRNGIFPSPHSNNIAYYRMDESPVAAYPLVLTSTRIASLDTVKYPMAGMKSHHVTVHVFNIATRKTIQLRTGAPKDKYLTNITWSPDEKIIFVTEVNRNQDTLHLNAYCTKTGRLLKTVLTETRPTWIEPEEPLYFLPGKSDEFLRISDIDGYKHLYHYNTDGKQIKQLTTGDWMIKQIYGFNPEGTKLYMASTERSPYENHTYEVDIHTGRRRWLTPEMGVHTPLFSPSKKHFANSYSTPSRFRVIELKESNTMRSHSITAVERPLPDYELPHISTGFINAADDTTPLYYRIVRPTNFNPEHRYPAIVYVYGGPHAQLVTHDYLYGARAWELYMAQKGYVVFVMDNRGSANRGVAFEHVIHRNLGHNEAEDQALGTRFLQSIPYVDPHRIGVHGWSYGGFMTVNLMLRYPELYKVGVAGGAVLDWSLYEAMYGERYMDRPQDNPEGYRAACMVDHAHKLEGQLLLIQDDQDDVVLMQHTFRFLKSAVDARIYPDLFIYPNHKHNVIGVDRVHLTEKIARYFDDQLKRE